MCDPLHTAQLNNFYIVRLITGLLGSGIFQHSINM